MNPTADDHTEVDTAGLDTLVEVETVRGPIPVAELGLTLTHEHLVCDWTQAGDGTAPDTAAEGDLFHRPVDAELAWLLNDDPACCIDNMRLDDPDAVIVELAKFADAGGSTIVECTNGDIGRDPLALQQISSRAGLNIVMGSGWYVHTYHDQRTAEATADELCVMLLAEFAEGVGTTGIKPGIIGEIGVSPQFTDSEAVRLRAAARAQRQLGVPLLIHLPGWQRRAFEVLDIVVEQEQVAPEAVVLCHMDPSGIDETYQRAVAERGVWLEFDMIGMPFFYAGQGQSPAPDQTATAIARLVDHGHAPQILLSHDLAAKSMFTKHGGNGVGYIPRLFLPRLQRHGVVAEVASALVTANPKRLFTSARRTTDGISHDSI